MADQANRLRDLVRERLGETERQKSAMTSRVICVTSGKGGVGKTNFTINLAIQMRRRHKRVILIDTDFGVANVEVLFGVIPQFNFGDVLAGVVDIEAALTVGPMGIPFLSGGSGLTSLSNVTDEQMDVLVNNLQKLDSMADVIIMDTGAGVSRAVINFVKAAPEAILVITPDPTSVTDAYALIKTVKETVEEPPQFKLVVNCVDNAEEGADVYEKLSGVCDRFLGIKLTSLGNIPLDPRLMRAVKRQQPVSLLYPNAESTRCIEAICAKLLNMPAADKSGFKGFLSRLIGRNYN